MTDEVTINIVPNSKFQNPRNVSHVVIGSIGEELQHLILGNGHVLWQKM